VVKRNRAETALGAGHSDELWEVNEVTYAVFMRDGSGQ
jgi:hypothetical protein